MNTTYDALGLDRPVVTFPSRYNRGRYTAACYRKMGFSSCIATSAEHYAEIAVRLGTDGDYRHAVIREIRGCKSVLYEDSLAVREHERLFEELLGSEKQM